MSEVSPAQPYGDEQPTVVHLWTLTGYRPGTPPPIVGPVEW